MRTSIAHTISVIGVIPLVDFGERLKLLRNRADLSQSQLAQRIGVTKGMISSYETSMRMPSYSILLKIAGLFNVSTDYLLGVNERDMLDISGLTDEQKALVCEIVNQFKANGIK